LFYSQFTRAGKEGAHEKGGVEGEVGRFQRNHLVPALEMADEEFSFRENPRIHRATIAAPAEGSGYRTVSR
jgi:hypothetical protein